ncbi:MAG: hypothetical protein ACRBN8_46060 [Nannocystales bacterium]
MNTIALSLLLRVVQPSPADEASPEASATSRAVTVRVTSALGAEDDDQVREVVTERVATVLADEGFSVGDGGSPRLLLIRIGRSEKRPTDYEVQLSAARNTESAPKRVETFECSCSAPELLDELDRRLAAHLPAIFEEPEPVLELDLPPEPPPPLPEPAPPAEPEPIIVDEQTWPAHQDTSLFAGGIASICVGGSILFGSAIGLPVAIANDSNRVPNIAYAAPALGVAGIVTGVILLRVNKKRHNDRLTNLTPLSVRF